MLTSSAPNYVKTIYGQQRIYWCRHNVVPHNRNMLGRLTELSADCKNVNGDINKDSLERTAFRYNL
jgi:hypothetical protein